MRAERLVYADMAAIAILLLNLIDGVFTLFWVHSGIAAEANPLMAEALERSPVTFMATKLLLVSLGVFLLFRLLKPTAMRVALTGCVLAYGWVFLRHLEEVPQLFS